MEITELHIKAMDIADSADIAKMQNHKEESLILYQEAFDIEREAALSAYDLKVGEPTVSVLLRSAASLGLESHLYRETEQLVGLALSGMPPEEIAEELRDILENVNFYRHLSTNGISLADNEFQFSISGNGVSNGMAREEDVSKRLATIKDITTRTIDRIRGNDFRKRGRTTKETDEICQSYLSVPRAASFAMTIRIGSSDRLKFENYQDSPNYLIDDIASNIQLVEVGDIDKLKINIKDSIYLENFINLTKELAPDGKEVNMVGITYYKEGKEVPVKLTRQKKDFSKIIESAGQTNDDRDPSEHKTTKESFSGILSAADATSEFVTLLIQNNKKIKIKVPDGLADIVKKYFDEQVQAEVRFDITANLRELISIDAAS